MCRNWNSTCLLFLLPSAGGPPMAYQIFSERRGWVPGLSFPRPTQESMRDGPAKNLGDFIQAAGIVTPLDLSSTSDHHPFSFHLDKLYIFLIQLQILLQLASDPFTSGVPSVSHSWRRLSWILLAWSIQGQPLCLQPGCHPLPHSPWNWCPWSHVFPIVGLIPHFEDIDTLHPSFLRRVSWEVKLVKNYLSKYIFTPTALNKCCCFCFSSGNAVYYSKIWVLM